MSQDIMQRLANNLHAHFALVAGHPCRFVFARFYEGTCDYISSARREDGAATERDLLAKWLHHFNTGQMESREPFEDELDIAAELEPLAAAMRDALTTLTGHSQFVLIVWPRDSGMYTATITRETAGKAMAELLERMNEAASREAH